MSVELAGIVRLTLLIGGVATLAALPPAFLVAWILARWRFPGKVLLDGLVHLPLVVPPVVTGWVLLIAFAPAGPVGAVLERWLGVSVLFRWTGAAIAAAVMAFPLMVRAMRLSIEAVDRRLEQAARTLGAGRWRTYATITLPLSVPALASFSIFQFLWVWNDLIVALYIGPNEGTDLVFPIRLEKQLGTFKDQLHLLNASAVISMIVPVIVFLAMQRYFIRGLLAGSVKGG